jgi:hypothetical protein
MIDLDDVVSKILSVPGSEQILFIIMYGSHSTGSEKPESDIDICIHHTGTERERADFRFKVLTAIDDERFDIHTYIDLPLYIKKDIFKGRVLFCRDISEASDIAYKLLREYDDFAPRYLDYIGVEALR